MIVLDTHIWIWWVHGDTNLNDSVRGVLDQSTDGTLCISAICCWEVAKLVECGRLELPCSVSDWIQQALAHRQIRLIDLSPEISVESTKLPGTFHRDPADQIIVATSRVLHLPLLTADSKILKYPHVELYNTA